MRIFKYIQDTRSEMRHVAWPTQTQTMIFTALVVVVSLLTAAYLGFFDFLLTKGLEATLGTGGSSSAPLEIEQEQIVPELDFSATDISGSEVEITKEEVVSEDATSSE